MEFKLKADDALMVFGALMMYAHSGHSTPEGKEQAEGLIGELVEFMESTKAE